MNAAAPSASPGRQTLQRLARDPLAVIAAMVVVVVVVLCAFAPLITTQAPDQQRTWLGVLPPGGSHPDCIERNVLTLGAPPELLSYPLNHGELRVTANLASEPIEYRLTLRQGVVKAARGAEAVEHLEVSGLSVIAADGSARPAPPVTITSGQAPPPGLFSAGERVLILRHDGAAQPQLIQAVVTNGRISTLTIANVSASTAVIAGAQITAVEVDRREQRLYHLLGTDRAGRDLFARVLYGGRISLSVGLVATLVSVLIGSLYGAIAAYAGNRTDRLMMGAVDVLYAIPFLFLVILLLVLFHRSFLLLFAALGAVQWLTQARIVRAQVLSLMNRDFVTAARAGGIPAWRIITVHLLPNCWGTIIAYGALTVPLVIMEESFLAFIGLGVTSNGVESWGGLIDAGRLVMGPGHNHLLWWPAGIMTLTLIALTILGDRLREALAPSRG